MLYLKVFKEDSRRLVLNWEISELIELIISTLFLSNKFKSLLVNELFIISLNPNEFKYLEIVPSVL